MPNPTPAQKRSRGRSGLLEIPAGLLDDDPGMKPDKHIFIEVKSPWYEITDDLPQLDLPGLVALRTKTKTPE